MAKKALVELEKKLLLAFRAQWTESRLIARDDNFSPNNIRTLYLTTDGLYIRRYVATNSSFKLEQIYRIENPSPDSFEGRLKQMEEQGYPTDLNEFEMNYPEEYEMVFARFKNVLSRFLTQKVMSTLDEIYVDEALVSGSLAPLSLDALFNGLRMRGADRKVSDEVFTRFIGVIPHGYISLDQFANCYRANCKNILYSIMDEDKTLYSHMCAEACIYENAHRLNGENFAYYSLQKSAYPVMDAEGGPLDRKLKNMRRVIHDNCIMMDYYRLFCKDVHNAQNAKRLWDSVMNMPSVDEPTSAIRRDAREMVSEIFNKRLPYGITEDILDKFIAKYNKDKRPSNPNILVALKQVYMATGVCRSYNISDIQPLDKKGNFKQNEGILLITEAYCKVIKMLMERENLDTSMIEDKEVTNLREKTYAELNKVLEHISKDAKVIPKKKKPKKDGEIEYYVETDFDRFMDELLGF